MERLTYSLAEAAEVAGVSVVTMSEWVHLNDFPALRAGKKWIIGKEQFHEWLKKHTMNRTVIKDGCYVSPNCDDLAAGSF